MHTLKPNYLLGFLKVLFGCLALILLISGVFPALHGRPVDWPGNITYSLIAGAFLGLVVCVLFTPRELAWNEAAIQLKLNFPGSGAYPWDQLEAYSGWSGRFNVFLLKFQDAPACRIFPACYRAADWEQFQRFLRERFPDKKQWLWIGSRRSRRK